MGREAAKFLERGGQWRCCSLALSIGFIELAAQQRENIRSSLIFLDESLNHLNAMGRAQVRMVLRRLLRHRQQTERGKDSDLPVSSNVTTIVILFIL